MIELSQISGANLIVFNSLRISVHDFIVNWCILKSFQLPDEYLNVMKKHSKV